MHTIAEASPHQPAPTSDLDWNLLVTSMNHRERDVRRALRSVVQLRRSPFRNVLVARVDEPTTVLAAVDELASARPRLASWLGRVFPIASTFDVDPDRFDAQARAAIAPLLDRLAARTFHVRVERRGHKGRIDSHAAERVLGTWISETLAARGTPGDVDFVDPDLVVAIEIVGPVAGVALVSRDLRQRYQFVRID
jgi:tRNA(Ser,Leu) C12 N-acetylase TAN1